MRKVEKQVNFTFSSSRKHKINYRIPAITNLHKAYTLAENIHSASEADAVVFYFNKQLKLDPVTAT